MSRVRVKRCSLKYVPGQQGNNTGLVTQSSLYAGMSS